MPIRHRSLAGNTAIALVLVALPLSAQTTPTERAAARDVVAQIEALQARLAPEQMARRMAAARDAERDRIVQRVEQLRLDGLRDLSDHIGRNPEVGWQEHRTVDTLTAVFKRHGFAVATGAAGLETAFVGSWDSPAGAMGPTVGIIVEYDALRSTTEPFHGCQHNAQSPVGFAVALALAEHMAAQRVAGRIRVYGTPAEEVGPPAKTIMWKAGVFEGADVLIRSHGSGETSRNRAGFGVCCLNINEVRYIFTGRSAHQRASWHGRNALSAAVMLYSAVDALRPSFRPEASIQGVIPEGGVAPNVVPDRAVVDYYLRYPDEVYLAYIDSMVANAARGAALATGTNVEIDRYGEYRDGITLGTLEELVFAYATAMGAPEVNPEPQRPAGYEETGFLTREIPGVSVSVYSSPAPGHSIERWRDSMKPVGHTGFLLDAKIMAAVAYHYLTDARFRAVVEEEHRTMAALFDEYLRSLERVYADEIRVPLSGR
jgi:amidohydrolase